MSTLRVSNIEAKADASSPTIDEKVKITNSQGRVLVYVDGKGSGITTVGINTTANTFTVDANNNVIFSGILTAANINTTGVSTFTRLNVGTGGTILTTTTAGLIGIGTTNPNVSLDLGSRTDAIELPQGTTSQRPTGNNPYIRWNTTNSALEVYNGTDWVEIITDYFPTGSVILG